MHSIQFGNLFRCVHSANRPNIFCGRHDPLAVLTTVTGNSNTTTWYTEVGAHRAEFGTGKRSLYQMKKTWERLNSTYIQHPDIR